MLESHYYKDMVEAGCDEAGRGCLAGSVQQPCRKSGIQCPGGNVMLGKSAD